MLRTSQEILTEEQSTSSDLIQHLGHHFYQIHFLYIAENKGGIVLQNIPLKPLKKAISQTKAPIKCNTAAQNPQNQAKH